MQNGQNIQKQVRNQRAKAENEIRSTDHKIELIERSIQDLKGNRETLLHKLADTYLPKEETNKTGMLFHHADETIKALFQQKKERRRMTILEIEHAISERDAMEEEISQIQEETGILGKKEKAKIEKAREALKSDAAFLEIDAGTAQLEQKYLEHHKNLEQMSQEFEAKLVKFKKDRFFNYLNSSSYGTSTYITKTGKLVRMIDDMIAGSTRFPENKRNHDMMVSAQTAGLEMVNGIKKALEAKQAQLAEHISAAEEKAGIPALQADIQLIEERTRESIEEHDEIERKIEKLLSEKKSIDDGNDPTTLSAKNRMKEILGSQSIMELRKKAKETTYKKDDQIVDQLEETEELLRVKRKDANTLIETRNGQEANLEKIQKFERKFSRQNYDSRNSRFPDSFDIDNLLTAYIAGSLSEGSLWNNTEREHETYRPSSYGSSSSSYGGGFSGGFGGGSDSGGFGGGGFSSGGGFDSGGFSTGGDF